MVLIFVIFYVHFICRRSQDVRKDTAFLQPRQEVRVPILFTAVIVIVFVTYIAIGAKVTCIGPVAVNRTCSLFDSSLSLRNSDEFLYVVLNKCIIALICQSSLEL